MSKRVQSERCVRIADEASVRTIAKIHAQILAEYQKSDVVRIDVTAITDADLTFVQLVEAARRSATADGKRIALTAPAGGVLLDTLQRGGFLSEPNSAAFWAGATESN